MIISLIAAMSEERVIGREGRLPWNIPVDLARFKAITMGHTVVMGRRTYHSIGHPLPGRKNIVLTRSLPEIEGCLVARSLPEALSLAQGDEEIFICGGGALFGEALPFCQRVYLTVVHRSYRGDVLFPELPAGFLELHREELTDHDPPLSFLVYERVERLEPGEDVQALRKKGEEAMLRELYFLASRCFELALAMEEDTETACDLAFCRAKTGGNLQEALRQVESALQSLPESTRCHLSLARIQFLAGDRRAGLETLRRGVQLGGGREFQTELERVGTREQPPIEALPRSHPVNKYLGLLLSRIGLR